jgi:hypothetical protein
MAEPKDNVMFAIDFSSKTEWLNYVDKYPCLLNSGSRYFKTASAISISNEYSASLGEWCNEL